MFYLKRGGLHLTQRPSTPLKCTLIQVTTLLAFLPRMYLFHLKLYPEFLTHYTYGNNENKKTQTRLSRQDSEEMQRCDLCTSSNSNSSLELIKCCPSIYELPTNNHQITKHYIEGIGRIVLINCHIA